MANALAFAAKGDALRLRLFFTFALIFLLSACGGHDIDDEANAPTPIPIEEVPKEGDEGFAGEDSFAVSPIIPGYFIDLDIDPASRTVTGVQRISLHNTTGFLLDRVFFNLPLNAFSIDYPGVPFFAAHENRIFHQGIDFGEMVIQMATVNLSPVEFSTEHTLLTVYFDESLPPGTTTEIALAFEATIPRISHRTGGNDYAMWFGNFLPTLAVLDGGYWHFYPYYPAGHPFFTASANFNVTITAPVEFTIVATGLAIRTEGDETAETSFEVPLVRDFAFALLSDAYASRRILTDGGVDIAIYYHEDTVRAQDIDAILNTARAAFEHFSARIGVLPYDTLALVETELFLRGSIKYPGMIFVDSRQMRAVGVHQAITRDIGHQWFYNVVGHNPVTEPWLTLGLASFLQLGFTMDDDEISDFAGRLHTSLTEAFNYLQSPELSRDLSYYQSWQDFQNVQQERGMLLFYALWQKMGTDAFDEFLRAFYQRYAFSIATSQGMMALVEEVHGGPLDDFFRDWINSPTLPPLRN